MPASVKNTPLLHTPDKIMTPPCLETVFDINLLGELLIVEHPEHGSLEWVRGSVRRRATLKQGLFILLWRGIQYTPRTTFDLEEVIKKIGQSLSKSLSGKN